jgi:hypothetical protein
MLLQDYIKCTPDGPEREHVVRVLEALTKVSVFVNETKKAVDARARMQKLDHRIVVDKRKSKMLPQGVGAEASRQLLREGFLAHAPSAGGNPKKFYVFIFSDMILISQQQPMKQKRGGHGTSFVFRQFACCFSRIWADAVVQTMKYDFQTSLSLESNKMRLIEDLQPDSMWFKHYVPKGAHGKASMCFQLAPKGLYRRVAAGKIDKISKKQDRASVYTWICENGQDKLSWIEVGRVARPWLLF